MFEKILHIDDDPVIRGLVERALQLSYPDKQIKSVALPSEALQTLGGFCPDLILLDWYLPEMTGDVLLAEMRKTDNAKTSPVILMTGKKETEAANDDFVIGVIEKPFRPKEFVPALEEIWAQAYP